MKPFIVEDQIAHPEPTEPEAEWGLKVVALYQHEWNRARAKEVRQRIEQVAGKEALCFNSWSLADLDDTAIFAEASWQAADADVIIVAIDVAEELPPEFYVWIDVWLPRRCQITGAFVALLHLPSDPGDPLTRTRTYLEAVARQGGLDFLMEERQEPVAALKSPPERLQAFHAA
jgi:hypothetical protein